MCVLVITYMCDYAYVIESVPDCVCVNLCRCVEVNVDVCKGA